LQRPARLAVVRAAHRDDGRLQSQQAIEAVTSRIIREIGVDLRPLRPLRAGIRHRLVGVAIKLLSALRLPVRLGAGRVPARAEISTLLDNGPLVTPRGESLRRRKTGDAGADNANLLWADHVSFLSAVASADTLALFAKARWVIRTKSLQKL